MTRPTGPPDALACALVALRDLAVRRATDVVPVPGGVAVLHRELPAAHDHGRLLVWQPCAAEELAAAADRVLGGAGLDHRLVEVHDPRVAAELRPGLAAVGYRASDELLMLQARAPDRPLGDGPEVVELSLDERVAVATADWARDQPDWDAGTVRQLGERARTLTGATDPTFLAVRDADGAVLAHADLYLHADTAQVEEVLTVPAAQGRGLASRLVLEAARRARASGHDLVFLVADADDWPRQLYARLGFDDLGTVTAFRR